MNEDLEIHTIRLHGPWVAKVLAVFDGNCDVDIDHEFKVKVPLQWESWPLSNFRGQIEFRRNFNRPTGLEPDQPVWLVIEQAGIDGKVYLNDREIGGLVKVRPQAKLEPNSLESDLRVDVGSLLELSNLIRFETDMVGQQSGELIASVRLEIQQ